MIGSLVAFSDDANLGFEFNPLHRSRFSDPRTTGITGRQRFVRPEGFHGLGKVFDDVSTVEFLIVNQCMTVGAVELLMLGFSRWTSSLDDDTNRTGLTLRRMRYATWNEEGLAFLDGHMFQTIIVTNDDHHVTLELEEVFL